MKMLKASGALRHPCPYKLTSLMQLCCATSANWADQSWAPLKHILRVKKKEEKGENLFLF